MIQEESAAPESCAEYDEVAVVDESFNEAFVSHNEIVDQQSEHDEMDSESEEDLSQQNMSLNKSFVSEKAGTP